AFIGALGVLVLLAPQSDATKARSDAVEMQTVGEAGAPMNIVPADAGRNEPDGRVAVGDRSAD
ncbi:MAG: hypothetical protein WBX07_03355, partial [Rhodoplanes sp.]